MADMKEEEKLNDEKQIELAMEDYKDRVNWWVKNLKDSTIHVPKENERRPGQEQNVIEEPEDPEIEEEPIEVENGVNQERERDPQETDNVAFNSTQIDSIGYDKVVSGKISSIEDGSGLPGVNVVVKGTTRGTISDFDGNYKIAINNDEVLVFSFVGMVTEEFEIGNRRVMDVALGADVQQLSEVVVTAMGIEVNRRSLGYSVSTVTNVLQGQVAGVQIDHAVPGSVVVRGNSAVSVGEKPMYLIDGEISDQSEFESLDPDEVASMNVIKGADAAGLYGSQAADGVIVIVTNYALDDEINLPDSITQHFVQDLVIKDWEPNEPYLDSLKSVPKIERYDKYLHLKEEYGRAPSFYLSVGSFFINDDQTELGMRILSNLAELELENYELLKMLAHTYRQIGAYNESIYLFNKIRTIRDDEPHSLRDLALSYQANGEFQKALDLFNEIVLTSWHDDERFPLFKSTVIGEMNNLISLYKKEIDLNGISKDLINSMPVDVRVVLDWNTIETDLDLWVIEPDGEKCYFSNYLTMNGGRLVEDYMDGYGPEEYILKNAPTGEYTIEVDYYDDRVQKIAGPTTLQVTIYTNYGRKNQQQKSMTLQLKDEEETVKVGKFKWND